MAKTQRVMWTALPNGLVPGSGGKKLRLSIYVSPSLEDDASPGRLDHFPDFYNGPGDNWAAKANGLSFRVEVMNNLAPALADTPIEVGTYTPVSQASPELWDLMFKPDTAVPSKRQIIPSAAAMKVNTFSVAGVLKQVQDQYIAVGANPALVSKLPAVDKMVTPPGFSVSPIMRLLPSIMRPPTVRVAAMSADGDPHFKEFEEFHKPFDSPNVEAQAALDPSLDVRPQPKRPNMNFQTALSTLGEYPALLVGLGIVIDLEIPYDSKLKSGRRIRVVPTTTVSGSASGWTAYDISTGLVARTRSVVVKSFASRPKGTELKNGYMVMRTPSTPSKSPTMIATVDADFAGLALKATAVSAAMAIKEVALARARTMRAAAITPGVAVDVARPISGTVSPSTTYEPMGLPGLGPSTMSLVRNRYGDKLKKQIGEAAAKDAYLVSNQDKMILNYAEDLARGYRIDVWDSVTKKWHKLCARTGQYAIGGATIRFRNGRATMEADASVSLEDEGWIQTALVSDPNKTSDGNVPSEVWVHEHMFDWTGWSLAVPRPGAALSTPDEQGNSAMIRESTGPDGKPHLIGQWIDPKFPLATDFSVPDGTLPRKRFGTTYRFRARSVDLAGHSVDFAPGSVTADPGGTGDTDPLVSDRIVNRRSDPVKAPVVVITEHMKPGESPNVLVVRSNYDTPPASIAHTARHITPPRSSVEMAEELSGLDNALQPGKPVDPTLWSMLEERDKWEFKDEIASEGKVKALALGPAIPPVAISPNLPPLAVGQLRTKPDYVPKEYKQQAPVDKVEKDDGTLPYLPDMLSRGATMTGLPGTPSTASGVRMSAAAASTSPPLGSSAKVGIVKVPVSVSLTETVKTVMVDFDQTGQKWYNKRSFKLVVKGIEALDTRLAAHATPAAPKWDSAARTLTVELPKAEKFEVELSSFTNPADLNLMEIYEWGTRPFVRKTTARRLIAMRQMALPTAAALPTAVKSTMSTEVKALVGLSIVGRNWTITPHDTLTLIHPVQQPLIEPKFTTYAYVSRVKGDVSGVLIDWMAINGRSTAKLDVEAQWHENVDDPSAGVPKWKNPNGSDTSVGRREKVFNVTVGRDDTKVLDLGHKAKVTAAKPLVAFADDPKSNAQRHFFGDTKHRYVNYKATATSRFSEFFADDPNAVFTRTSPEAPIHVPSTARPASPGVQYVIPTYGWTKTATTSKRSGGGLRVYLDRPWFTSGDNEQLAVVLTPPSTWFQSPYHTRWAHDPIWATSGELDALRPSVTHFQGRAGQASGLKLAEDGSSVSIAAYDVDYDAERDLWYADMQIDPKGAYYPFIKLILARYQKYSLSGLELSPIVVTDFAQLAAARSASVQWTSATQLRLTVSGQSYSESHWSKFHAGSKATLTAQFEKQSAEHPSGWLPIGTETDISRKSIPLILLIAGVTSTTWEGTLTLPTVKPGEVYRLVIREYEWFHSVDAAADTAAGYGRLVYADAMPLTPPSA